MPEALVDLATLWLQVAVLAEITTAAVNRAAMEDLVVVVVAVPEDLGKVAPIIHSI
jgi:hypothetical protein